MDDNQAIALFTGDATLCGTPGGGKLSKYPAQPYRVFPACPQMGSASWKVSWLLPLGRPVRGHGGQSV